MREKAVRNYNGKYNCSQCILKAAESEFNIRINKQCYEMLKCHNNGMGIGGTCSALEAGVFLFGLLFDEATCLSLRMKLIHQLQIRFGTVYCCKLKEKINEEDCQKVIGEVADMVMKIIYEQLMKKRA